MKKEPLSDLADKYFDLISEDIKEKIIKYPIYTLYKELKWLANHLQQITMFHIPFYILTLSTTHCVFIRRRTLRGF